METDFIPLELDDEFQFACSPEVPCFNQCCRDINQYLTPYDIFRLKKRLNMDSGDFLNKYTVEHIGPQTGLPNLWLVGDSIFPGQSTAGVTLGGMRVAAAVLAQASSRRLFFSQDPVATA